MVAVHIYHKCLVGTVEQVLLGLDDVCQTHAYRNATAAVSSDLEGNSLVPLAQSFRNKHVSSTFIGIGVYQSLLLIDDNVFAAISCQLYFLLVSLKV